MIQALAGVSSSHFAELLVLADLKSLRPYTAKKEVYALVTALQPNAR